MSDPTETKDPVTHGSSYDESKGALENLHDAIGSYLGFGKREAIEGGKSVTAGEGADQAVNEGIKDANKSNPDY
jgi:hypothetical protein